MIQRAVPALLGLFALSLPLVAQTADDLSGSQTLTPEQLRLTGQIETAPALSAYRPDIFANVDSTVLIHGLPALTLLDGRRFPINSELGRMGMTPLNLFPLAFLSAVEVQKAGASPMINSEAPGGSVDLRLKRFNAGGEVGVFFGKSGGKYGREDFSTYIISGVGNDKVNITVGAAYQESTFSGPRRGR